MMMRKAMRQCAKTCGRDLAKEGSRGSAAPAAHALIWSRPNTRAHRARYAEKPTSSAMAHHPSDRWMPGRWVGMRRRNEPRWVARQQGVLEKAMAPASTPRPACDLQAAPAPTGGITHHGQGKRWASKAATTKMLP